MPLRPNGVEDVVEEIDVGISVTQFQPVSRHVVDDVVANHDLVGRKLSCGFERVRTSAGARDLQPLHRNEIILDQDRLGAGAQIDTDAGTRDTAVPVADGGGEDDGMRRIRRGSADDEGIDEGGVVVGDANLDAIVGDEVGAGTGK